MKGADGTELHASITERDLEVIREMYDRQSIDEQAAHEILLEGKPFHIAQAETGARKYDRKRIQEVCDWANEAKEYLQQIARGADNPMLLAQEALVCLHEMDRVNKQTKVKGEGQDEGKSTPAGTVGNDTDDRRREDPGEGHSSQGALDL